MSTSWVLPVMICSEDGILAVVEQGEEPIELLAEPCAINSFDIDRQNPSVMCFFFSLSPILSFISETYNILILGINYFAMSYICGICQKCLMISIVAITGCDM
ncbi:hypothetical protein CsSME_00008220 [Camellia sinensis var. sinensis]